WNALAAEIERVHRELGGAGLRFADVAARFSDPTLAGDASGIFAGFDDGARWTALAYVQREYEATLEAVGRADAELARMDALRAGAIAAEHPVWLVGVSEMPPVTHALVRAAAAHGTPIHALVHAPAERAGDFDAEGCIRSDVWAIAPVPLGDEQLAIRDSPADQAGHVVGLLAGLDGAWPADQISVAVPDAELVPYLEQALGSAGVPVRYAAGRAISRTGPYRLLEAMAEYLAGERFDAFTTLLRHPDVAAWLRRHGESAAGAPVDPDASIADADAYHTERLPARFSPPRRRTQGARRPVERARDALIGPGETALLAPLRGGKRSLAEWSPLVLDVLVRAYGDRPLIRDRPGDRPILEACERIRDVAAGYHRLPQPLDEECDAATAIRLILADVARLDVPPAPDAAAVELLGWLELHLDDAPVKVVTGFNEPFLPESAHGDALLPDRLRGALGLVDNRGRRARDAYRLTALLHSTAVTHVVAGRRDARGDPLRPSRLMLALEGRPLAERVRRFYGEAPGETLPAGAAPALVAAGTPPAPAVSAFVLPPEPTIVLPSPVRRLNVSAFRALLRDPYMFALEYVYGLETVDDSARELDPLG
ncbi:MAG TPA: hypothetical protein VNZ57_15980, partial [Longimicrobiales bacterium]|nr:hypothetical protein [Longimicrobiales bacterium]